MKKRILAFLIAVSMILACTVSVYAETPDVKETSVSASEITEDSSEKTKEQSSTDVSSVSDDESVSETSETSETSVVEENPEVTAEPTLAPEAEAELEAQSEVKIACKIIKKGLEITADLIKYQKDQHLATEMSGEYYFDENVDLGPIIVGEGGLTMVIADGVTVTCDASSYRNYAGIKAAYKDRPLVITTGAAMNPDGSYAPIQGTGTLIATGGFQSAGIGCNYGDGYDAHQITIESGNIYAYGGDYGAGIGGGLYGLLTDLTINGGYVEAHGGKYAAGIGSGEATIGSSGSNNITINGGTVYAYGSEAAAGIGGGRQGSAHSIYINENISGVSTYVEAHGGYGGAGIGGGDGYYNNPNGHDITITGGTVKAYGCSKDGDPTRGGAGIGSGARQKSYSIKISGGDVTAVGGGGAAGIGGGSEGEGFDITISDGIVNACSGGDGNGAGIGSGRSNSAKRITITGGKITATSNNNGAGIGAGEKGEVKKDSYGISITGGYITATSKGNGAGIGAGAEKKADGIEISGGTIIATSNGSGAGIGGGEKGEGKDITINDGYITAESKGGGAGIGGAYKGKANNININGGIITAYGSTKDGKKGYGLGQGGDGSQEKIYVKTNLVSYHSDNKTDWTQYPAKSGDLTKDSDWNKLNYSGFKTNKDVTPYITLGAQLGSPVYGTPVESLYSVTASYVSGEIWNYNWYADEQATVPCAAPAGITTNESTSACKITNGTSTPAGTWYFTLTCGGVTSNVAAYTVAKIDATITSGSAAKVYDGTPLTCDTYEVSGFLNGEGVSVTCTGSQTEIGSGNNTFTYTEKSGTDLNNYNITETTGNLMVTDDPFVVTGENYSGMYDGQMHIFTVQVTGKNGKDLTTASGMKIEYNTSSDGTSGSWNGWTQEAPAVKNAGILYVKARATYNSITSKSTVYTLNVDRRNVILTSESAEKEYDGTALAAPDVEIGGDGFVGSEGFENEPKANGIITKVGSVSNEIGEYIFNEATNDANYVVEKNPGTLSVIAKSAPITITTESNSKKYNGTPISVGAVSYTEDILAPGDTLTVTLSRIGDNAAKDAGTYDNGIDSYKVLNASGEDVTGCYSFAEPVIGHLIIDKRYITLTSESAVFVYDGEEHSATDITISGDGLVGGESLNYADFAVVKDLTEEPVDNTFTYSGSGNFDSANYDITAQYGKLSVVDEIGITAANVEALYDGTEKEAPAEVTGTANAPEYSTSVDGETWSSYVTTVPSMKDAGMLYIKAKVTDGGQSVETEYTLTVRPRSVTIATKSASKPYDGTALTENDPVEVIVTGQGFVPGETWSITITGSQTDVGSSKNSFSYELVGCKAQNYVITEEPGTLTVTVNDKPILITSGSDEQTYNAMPLTSTDYTATWGGEAVVDGKLCGNDVLKVMPIGSITEVGSTSNQFYYQVVRDGVDVTAFYTFGEGTEGTLTVTKRSVVINTASDEKVYDGTALTNDDYTITGDGFVSGEGFETVNVAGTRLNAGTAQNELDADTPYTFKAGTNEANYKVSVVTGTLKVNKRNVNVSSGSAASKYDDCPTEGLSNKAQCTVSGDGFVSGEMESGYPQGEAVLEKPATEPEVGIPVIADNTIAYKWTGNGNPANYEITENLGKLVVTNNSESRAVATDYVGVYDGQSHGGSVTSTLKGATIRYSTDGKDVYDESKSWETIPPTATDVSTTKVDVKVTDGSNTAYTSYKITITKRDLTITAGSAQKVYDATALKCGDYTIGGDGYAGEESAEIVIGTMSGQDPVDVGTVKNVVKEVNAQNGFKGANYNITGIEGTLEITKRPVILISKSMGLTPKDQKDTIGTSEDQFLANAYELAILAGSPMEEVVYDGQSHSRSGEENIVEVGNPDHGGLKKIEGMGFVGDQGLEYSNFTTAVDAGMYSNEFDYTAKPGTDLDNYSEIKCLYGVMKISPRAITLTSANDEKMYDGTPLTNDTIYETTTEAGDAFVAGDGADYDVTGTRTKVGQSDNTFQYTLKAGTKETNYDITTEEGTLEVYSNDTLRLVVPENQVYEYDGTAHGDEAEAFIGDDPCTETIWYSGDNGYSYVNEAPQLTDVGTLDVLVRVKKEGYVTAEGDYTITVKASDDLRIVVPENQIYTYDGEAHGEAALAYINDEFCGDAKITYSTDGGSSWSKKVAQLTDPGTLKVIAKAEKKGYKAVQQSYTITVTTSDVLSIVVPDNKTYTYDGKAHGEAAVAYVGEEVCTDASITYSTDGGKTWSSAVAQLTNPGTLTVIAKAEKKGYEAAQKSYTITVNGSAGTSKTGDDNNALLYVILLFAAAAAAAVIIAGNRRRRNQR